MPDETPHHTAWDVDVSEPSERPTRCSSGWVTTSQHRVREHEDSEGTPNRTRISRRTEIKKQKPRKKTTKKSPPTLRPPSRRHAKPTLRARPSSAPAGTTCVSFWLPSRTTPTSLVYETGFLIDTVPTVQLRSEPSHHKSVPPQGRVVSEARTLCERKGTPFVSNVPSATILAVCRTRACALARTHARSLNESNSVVSVFPSGADSLLFISSYFFSWRCLRLFV